MTHLLRLSGTLDEHVELLLGKASVHLRVQQVFSSLSTFHPLTPNFIVASHPSPPLFVVNDA